MSTHARSAPVTAERSGLLRAAAVTAAAALAANLVI